MATLLPIGRILQLGFVVQNVEDAVQTYVRDFNVGGWLMLERQRSKEVIYRGVPATIDISVALAYSGDIMLELIQQHGSAPSVYSEAIADRRYGLHHLALATLSIENSICEYQSKGYRVAMRVENQNGRAAYLEKTGAPPAMLELLEISGALETFFGRVHALRVT